MYISILNKYLFSHKYGTKSGTSNAINDCNGNDEI